MAELTMNSERRLTTAGEGNTPLMGMSALLLVFLALIGQSGRRGGLKNGIDLYIIGISFRVNNSLMKAISYSH